MAPTLSTTATAGSSVSDPNPTNNTTAPVLTSVIPVADVAVSKSASQNVNLGANFTYTIAVTNFGPSLATSLAVTDSLPECVTFVSASGGCPLAGSPRVLPNFDLAAR